MYLNFDIIGLILGTSQSILYPYSILYTITPCFCTLAFGRQIDLTESNFRWLSELEFIYFKKIEISITPLKYPLAVKCFYKMSCFELSINYYLKENLKSDYLSLSWRKYLTNFTEDVNNLETARLNPENRQFRMTDW